MVTGDLESRGTVRTSELLLTMPVRGVTNGPDYSHPQRSDGSSGKTDTTGHLYRSCGWEVTNFYNVHRRSSVKKKMNNTTQKTTRVRKKKKKWLTSFFVYCNLSRRLGKFTGSQVMCGQRLVVGRRFSGNSSVLYNVERLRELDKKGKKQVL